MNLQLNISILNHLQKILHVGLCLPVSCANDEIGNLAQNYFNSTQLEAQIMHDYQPNVLKVKNLNSKTSWLDKISFQLIGYYK